MQIFHTSLTIMINKIRYILKIPTLFLCRTHTHNLELVDKYKLFITLVIKVINII